jgi:hypothetical protein
MDLLQPFNADREHTLAQHYAFPQAPDQHAVFADPRPAQVELQLPVPVHLANDLKRGAAVARPEQKVINEFGH